MKIWEFDGGGGIGNWWLLSGLQANLDEELGVRFGMRTNKQTADAWREGRKGDLSWVNFGQGIVDQLSDFPEVDGRVDFHVTDDHSLAPVLANDDVELVIGCTPPKHHHPRGIQVLQAGKHLLSEKPFAWNTAEAAELISTARSEGVKVMVAMVVQQMGEFMFLNEAIRDGRYGTLKKLSLFRGVGVEDPCASGDEKKVRGDTLRDLTGHDLHQLMVAAGGKLPTSVAVESDLPPWDEDFVRGIDATFSFDNGLEVHVDSGAVLDRADFNFGQGFEAEFDNAGQRTQVRYRIEVVNGQFNPLQPLEVVVAEGKPVTPEFTATNEFDWFARQLRHAAQVLHHAAPLGPFCPLAAKHALHLEESVRQAIASNGTGAILPC